MYEISAFLSRPRKPLPLSIICFPSGRFGFVGSGPVELFYTGPADAIETGRKFGMGLVRHLEVEAATWDTREEAAAAAVAIGVTLAGRD